MNFHLVDDFDLLLRTDLEVEDIQEVSSWIASDNGMPLPLSTPNTTASFEWNDGILGGIGSERSFQHISRSSRPRSISPRAGKPKSPRVTYKDKLNELLVIKTIFREKNALNTSASSMGSSEPSYESAVEPFNFTSHSSPHNAVIITTTTFTDSADAPVTLSISDPMHPRYAGICPTKLKHGRSKNKKQKTEAMNTSRDESLTLALSDVTDEEQCSSPSSNHSSSSEPHSLNSSISNQSFEDYEWNTAEAETVNFSQPLPSQEEATQTVEAVVRIPRSPRNIVQQERRSQCPLCR